MRERNFFKTHHTITSPDPGWIEQYLSDRTLRITYLLRNEFPNDFWQHYSDVFHEFVSRERLLLRSKVIRSGAVHFIQVWDSEADAVHFDGDANGEKKPLEHLEKMGFGVENHFSQVTYSEVRDLITDIQKFPHLLQVVNKLFYTPGMKVGDPLKLNNGHLPFQTK